MKRRVKAKGRKIVRKARKNSPTIAKNTGKAVAYAAGARFMQRQLGTPMTAAYFGGTLLAKAAKGAYVQSSKKKKGKKK